MQRNPEADEYVRKALETMNRTPEEVMREAVEKLIAQCRDEFHLDMSFDEAVQKLEEFDRSEPFIPCLIRSYGDTRVCFRVFEKFFIRTGYASLSVFVEESPDFGVDVVVIASGGGEGKLNMKRGVSEDYIAEFKSHMGISTPKIGLKERAKRYFFE